MSLRLLSLAPDAPLRRGCFDVRGWPVRGRGGEPLGSVHDLLLDEEGAPRFVDVKLRSGWCVLLPIGDARVDASEDEVRVPVATSDALTRLPVFHDDAAQVTQEFETDLCRRIDAWTADEPETSHAASSSPAAPASPTSLVSLEEAEDLRVEPRERDARGWTLVAANGAAAGEVLDLLIDPEIMKARYLVCRVTGAGRRILVPASFVTLDPNDRRVLLDLMDTDALRDLPSYSGLPVEAEDEARVIDAFTGGGAPGTRYRHPRFNADHFFGTRAKKLRSTAP